MTLNLKHLSSLQFEIILKFPPVVVSKVFRLHIQWVSHNQNSLI